MYPSPSADTDDCSEGVTVTVMGILDAPSSCTTTSTNFDDSEPVKFSVAKSTTNTEKQTCTCNSYEQYWQ